MARQDTGGRLAWKERIDRSAWVDDTEWVDDAEQAEGDPSVEFLEAEPSAYRLSETQREEAPSILSSTSARFIGLGALAIVLLSLGLLSRPGDQDPFDQLSPDQQQAILQRQAEEAGRADAEVADEALEDAAQPQPIPTPGDATDEDAPAAPDAEGAADSEEVVTLAPLDPLRAELGDLPGVLYLFSGSTGSLVQIVGGERQPTEELVPVDDSPAQLLTAAPDQPPSLLAAGGVVLRGPDGLAAEPTAADRLLPADVGVLLVEEGRSAQTITATSAAPGADGSDGTSEPIELAYDLVPLGGWQGRLLAHKAGAVWLLDAEGGAAPVSTGHVVGFDGRYLVMVRCAGPADCRIEVGPPDQPTRRSVAVPEELLGRDIHAWTHRVAVSPDGERLALVDQRNVSLPAWIDLQTGEIDNQSESVRWDSPVAWSPDGRWLAFALADDDVLLWDTESDRSWWVFLDRQVTDLAWVAAEPAGS